TLELWPPFLELPAQVASALRATAVWPTGDAIDVTAWTVFSSSDSSVAAVSNAAGRRGELAGIGPGVATVTGQFLGASSRTSVTVVGVAPTQITVTGTGTFPAGQPARLGASAHFSDGSDQDVTEQASWTSSDPATLRVRGVGPSRGTALGLTPASADARARFLGLSGAATAAVSAPALSLLAVQGPTGPVPAGARVPLLATASFAGGVELDVTARAAWSSSSPSVAAVWSGATGGVVEGRSSGTSVITATFQGLQASTPVSVSQAVLTSLSPLPLAPSAPLGTSLPLRVLGSFSDGSQLDLTGQARWSSADGTRLLVSNGEATRGLAMALAAGPTAAGVAVTRPDGSQATASLLFTGTAAAPVGILIRPPAALLSVSGAAALSLGATALLSDGTVRDVTSAVTWSTRDAGIVSVSASGLLTAVSPGKSVVSAVLGSLTGTAPVEVVP
ncbi:MAG TPA: Ig-like domain-containing protein, partial [Myxococcaceae bacterium]|nr:Ig-like domain-containing protein [Myxococcaceae bacterium]